MKKLLVVLLSVLVLSGCEGVSHPKWESICLEGIRYWQGYVYQHGFLAPHIDPETLKPIRCRSY